MNLYIYLSPISLPVLDTNHKWESCDLSSVHHLPPHGEALYNDHSWSKLGIIAFTGLFGSLLTASFGNHMKVVGNTHLNRFNNGWHK